MNRGGPWLQTALMAGMAAVLCGCTTVVVYGPSGAAVHKGVLFVKPPASGGPTVVSLKGIGVVPGALGGVTVGVRRETAVFLSIEDQCRVVILEDKPGEAAPVLDLLFQNRSGADICTVPTRASAPSP